MLLYKHRIYCETEAALQYLWKENDTAITVCPTNPAHAVTANSVAIESSSDLIPLNQDGVRFVDVGLRRGTLGSESFTIVTHDLGDRTSWYQFSMPEVNLVLSTADGLVFQAAAGKRHWIDIHGKNLTVDTDKILEKDGTLSSFSKYEVTVKVDDVVVTTGFTVDFTLGKVTFGSSQTGVVKASFYHNDGVTNRSNYLIKPVTGMKFLVEHVELQFSKTTTFTGPIIFETWAGGSLSDYADFSDALYAAGYGQAKTVYRGLRDLINWCNNQYPVLPVSGIDGFTADVLVFPFKFLISPEIKNSQGTLFRVGTINDVELVSELATTTFYMENSPE